MTARRSGRSRRHQRWERTEREPVELIERAVRYGLVGEHSWRRESPIVNAITDRRITTYGHLILIVRDGVPIEWVGSFTT